MRAVSTLERVWVAYCATMVVLALGADGGGDPGHRPGAFVAVHAAVLLLQAVPALGAGRWQPRTVRTVRAVLACACLPAVFSAMKWLLPHVHPEAFEFTWYRLDVALFGGDSTAMLRQALPAAGASALQVVYASFYFVPMLAAGLVGAAGGGARFDRALTILVGGFLCSYALYVWFPTLAPKVVLPAALPPDGAFTAGLRALIDAAEANPWDCFPSGHTMLSLTSALVVWRWARGWLWLLLLIVVPLVASTMLLRYHWPVDVAAGAALSWPCVRLCDLLLDRDGAPAA
jgi:membrane-associated phospholipid phosphatase